MTTLRPNGRQTPGTYPNTSSDNFIRGEVSFNSPGVAAGATTNIRLGRLPANADIVGVKLRTVTAFVGPATATLSVGTAATTYADIIAATSVAALGATVTPVAAGLQLDTTNELDVFAQVILGAGAPTAGRARVFIDYTLPGVQ
jgi:hypothetical protein